MAAGLFSKVSVAITASTGGLARGLGRARQLLNSFGRAASAPARIPLGLGFLAAAKAAELAAGAVRRFSGAVNFAVQSAASLTEQQNRVDVVFGDAAASVRDFAKSALDINIAEAQALQAAGTFGTLFNNIGLTNEQSAKFSVNLTQLAADMASFNEVSIDDALRAMRSALVGEIEPIRRMGIQLNDAALREKAFSMGLSDTLKRVLTPSQKMLAAYASIMEKSSIQQGDATRTAASLSNQQRKATGTIRNLATQIGQKLVPIFNAVVTAFNNAYVEMQAFVESISASLSAYGMLDGGIQNSISLTEIFIGVLKTLAAQVAVVSGFFQTGYGVMQLFAKGFYLLSSSALEALNSVSDVVAAFVTTLEATFRKLVFNISYPIRALLGLLFEALNTLGQQDLATKVGDALLSMEEFASADSGLGKKIQEGMLGDLAANARSKAEALGEDAAKNIQKGMDRVMDPLAAFRAAERQARIDQFMARIPVGPGGIGGLQAVGDSIKASVESLKAITVDSSAGEEFRNAILRGADPRVAPETDRQIEANTREIADQMAGLASNIGDAVGGQLAMASVTV